MVENQADEARSASSGSTHVRILTISWVFTVPAPSQGIWKTAVKYAQNLVPFYLRLSGKAVSSKKKKTLGLSVCRLSKMIRRHLHCSLTWDVIFANIWPGVKYGGVLFVWLFVLCFFEKTRPNSVAINGVSLFLSLEKDFYLYRVGEIQPAQQKAASKIAAFKVLFWILGTEW